MLGYLQAYPLTSSFQVTTGQYRVPHQWTTEEEMSSESLPQGVDHF